MNPHFRTMRSLTDGAIRLRHCLFCVLVALLISVSSAFGVNVPSSGSSTYTTCNATVYDCGGASGDYTNSCNGYLVIYPATDGALVSITSGSYNTENSFDKIYVYDGVGTNGTQLAMWMGTGTVTATITSTTGPLTIKFTSDGSVTKSGFALNVSCTPAPTPVVMNSNPLSTCSARWTDPGGNGNYSNNQDVTQTICSNDGSRLQVDFISFSLSSGDYLSVYDGNSTNASLIATYTGNTIPNAIYSTGTCLTFHFVSNASGVNTGWVALISCLSCATISTAFGSPCAPDGANPFCTDENPYGVTYPSGTTGNANDFFGTSQVGCLGSVPRPAFYFMRIDSPGNLLIYIEQHNASGSGLDVDFACWGPFTASNQEQFMDNLCCGFYDLNISTSNGSHRPSDGNHNNNMGGYPDGNLVDCSYNSASTEWCYIPNAQMGQFYLLLITNYNGGAGTITFNTVASSSTATTDCSLLAQVVNGGPYCEGDVINLTCQNPQSGATYTWTGPNGWTSHLQNPQIPNATTSMSGNYTLVMTVGGQTSEPATTEVVVNANPVAHISTNMDTVCTGQHATLTATGGNMYSWSTGNGGSSVNVSPQTSRYYYVTATTAGNCRDVDSIFIVAAQTKTTTLRDTICPGTEYQRNGFSLTSAETATGQNRTLQEHYTTTMGCDSLVTLYLRFYPQPTTQFSETRCDTFVWNGVTYTQSGDYQQRFSSYLGCDSTVTLHLTIHNSVNSDFSATNCDNYQWNDQTYTQSGNYVQHFQTIDDCDSTVMLHLTIHNSVSTDFNALACSQYEWDDSTYMASGNYTRHYQTVHGCDSAVTMHLTINPVLTVEFSDSNCDQYVWGDSIYDSSGNYVQHFTTAAGCDSTVTLHLTIFDSKETEWNATACEHFTWNNMTYDTTGDYTQRLSTIHDCDSVVTLHLVVNNGVATSFDTIACEQFVWNNQAFSQSGAFVHHYETVQGCDSMVTMNLLIDQLSVYVSDMQSEHCGHSDGSLELSTHSYQGTLRFDWDGIPDGHDNVAENLSAGQYSVSVSDSACSLDLECHVFVAPMPESCFSFMPNASSVSFGTVLQFVNCSQNVDSWHWDFGDGSTSEQFAPEYLYPQVGTYTVQLVVTDQYGCQDTLDRMITVREELTIFIPNAFSPNGDGLNDEFKPIGTEISEEGYSLYIYNRWGEMVFSTTNLHQGWDGTFKGRKAEVGSAFTYVLRYQNFEGRPFVRGGVVYVVD